MKTTKVCPVCKIEKPRTLEFFAAHKRDGVNAYCRECNATRMKSYRKEKRCEIREFLETLILKCLVCGEDHPDCMDFHHIDPKEKDFEIAYLKKRTSLNVLKSELRKCCVLCANCHRRLHRGSLSLPDDIKPIPF